MPPEPLGLGGLVLSQGSALSPCTTRASHSTRSSGPCPSHPVSLTPRVLHLTAPRALHLAPRSLRLRPALLPTPHPKSVPAPCTSLPALPPAPALPSAPLDIAAILGLSPLPSPSQCPHPCAQHPALPTSTHCPWDCMSSRTQGSDLLRVSRSRRCLQLTRSSTLESTASGAWEEGSGASPMVAAARGAARRDGGQAAPWVKGMRGDGAAAAFLAVSAAGW